MLGQIIRHDWRSLSADRTLWAIAAIMLVAIGYGVYNGAAWTKFQRDALIQVNEEEKERFATLRRGILDAEAGRLKPGTADPRSADTIGRRSGLRYAVLPPGPLAALGIGQSDLYPYYFKVSTASKDTFLNNDEIENPVHLLSGRFDAAFVILYLYPLVILALSYNLISGEKEAGTLSLTLSQPVALGQLVLGKVLLRFALVVCLAVGLALAGASLGGVDLANGGSIGRLALWSAVVAAYGVFWFALAVAVNAYGGSSTTNAMALSGAWLAVVLVVPSVLNVAAKVTHPIPSRVELINAMRTASRDATAEGSTLLARYLEDHPDLVATSEGEIANASATSFAVQDEVERRMEPVMDQFNQQLVAQQAVLDRYRYLSPAVLAQSALYDIAGTGSARYKHFLQLTDGFYGAWKAWFTPRVIQRTPIGSTELAFIPSFRFEEESLSDIAGRGATALFGLVCSTVLVVLVALIALRRYSIAG